MSSKEAGLIAGIIAATGIALYVFRDKISIPGLIYEGELTIPGTDLVNRSTLPDDIAKNVIDAYEDFGETIKDLADAGEDVIHNIGDLGDAVRVKEEDMSAYMDRLKNTFGAPTGVTPIAVTQDIIDKYSRTITTIKDVVVEPIKDVVTTVVDTDYLDRLKDFAAPIVEPIKVTQDILAKYSRSYTVL